MIKIKKLHKDAVIPTQAKNGDAGFDLTAIDDGINDCEGRYIEYDTGIAIQPPEGYHTEIFPRSSISKYGLFLANSIGLVDNGYRNSIKLRFKKLAKGNEYVKGDKIGQLVIRKTENIEFIEVDELSETERGDGGFGSSGV